MQCASCGKELVEVAVICNNCGAPTKNYKPPIAPAQGIEAEEALKYCMPIGVSIWALAAGYLALFSVLLLPAPFALFTGLMALRDIKRHPEKRGAGRAWFGIVMGFAGLLVGLVLLTSAAIHA